MAKKSPLYVVVCIVAQEKVEHASEIMTNMGIYFHLTALAESRETVGLMDMLGVSQQQKGIVAGFCSSEKMHDVVKALCRNLELYRENHGMAFSVPVNAISREDQNKILKFIPEVENKEPENKEPEKKEEKENDS